MLGNVVSVLPAFFFVLFLESIFDVIDQKFMFWWLLVRHPNLHGMLGNHQDHLVAFLSKQLVANGRALLNFWILSWTVYVRIMYVHSSLLIDFQIGGPCACNIHSSWSPSEFRMHLSMPIAKFSHSVHNLSFVLYMHLLQISSDRLTFTCILQLSENLLSDVHYPGAESVWVLPFLLFLLPFFGLLGLFWVPWTPPTNIREDWSHLISFNLALFLIFVL